jgi:hypothetical protein
MRCSPTSAHPTGSASTDRVFRTIGDLNQWNDGFFAARPDDHTVE